MSVKVLSEGIQELMGSPLLTEKEIVEVLSPILRKRPCLILLVLSLLTRRLLLPEIGLDAHNIALIYSFCLDCAHVGILGGLSIALRTHAALLVRVVVTEGRLRFEGQGYSINALVKHRGALLVIFKTLMHTPWLTKTDVAILMQAPIVKRLRADEKHRCQQEQFTKQTNFITACRLIMKIVQQHYLLLYKKYSSILYSIMQSYGRLFDAVESTDNAPAFQKYLDIMRTERSDVSQKIAGLGPYFKWRHYRDQLLEKRSQEKAWDQPTIIKTMMTNIHGFAEYSKAKHFNFSVSHSIFLQDMLQISSNIIPLENELKKHEETIETLLANNIRVVGISLPANSIKRCHDMLVLAGLIRQDVLNCSGTALFLLGVSTRSIEGLE